MSDELEVLDHVLLALQGLDRSVANLAGTVDEMNKRICALELKQIASEVREAGPSAKLLEALG